MPKLFSSNDESDLVRAERDVREAFTGLDLDLSALAAVSNIFRAATAVRNHMVNVSRLGYAPFQQTGRTDRIFSTHCGTLFAPGNGIV